MLVFKTKIDLQNHLLKNNSNKTSVGMVPTMGALHKGHISLVQKCVSENNITVVSIFVNPTQFDNSEDLKKYPSTLEEDISLLKQVSDKIIVFSPTASDIYDGNIISKTYNFKRLDKVMEGAFRDNHFNGVGTIVETLLTLVMPDNAYFGEKDYQQLAIIKNLIKTQNIPINIIGCPIVREANGLAMSSRNERLSATLRKEASFIYQTLMTAKKKFGTESALKIIEWVKSEFKNRNDLTLEYVQIANTKTLQPVLRKQKNKKYRIFIAVYANDVRLIDNIPLN